MRSLIALAVAAASSLIVMVPALAVPAHADNRVTPGNFTGYGFDQCVAPTQSAMDTWMEHSPFSAVGIYISGASRGCRSQPNLTREWVSQQLDNYWALLPITLGPQASCSTSFPRYGNDPVISDTTTRSYLAARRQGRLEADRARAAASDLGITRGSTLWYDLEAFDITNTRCRESALRFLHSWTQRLHDAGWQSGVYSSAASGIKMLDDARRDRPGHFELPDSIWIARWDGRANLTTSYISDDGWMPHDRVKQYKSGHNERWGGVTINIDSNFMSLGRGSQRFPEKRFCSEVSVNQRRFPTITPYRTNSPTSVKALQCMLRVKGLYDGRIDGVYDASTRAGQYAFQRSKGLRATTTWSRSHWMMILSEGGIRTVKRGHTSPAIARMQRALTAATGMFVPGTGTYDERTEEVVKAYQGQLGAKQSGVVYSAIWRCLQTGRYT